MMNKRNNSEMSETIYIEVTIIMLILFQIDILKIRFRTCQALCKVHHLAVVVRAPKQVVIDERHAAEGLAG